MPKSTQQEEDEGRTKTINTVRESVLWYLGHELAMAAESQREMVEKRCDREREKEKSVLYKLVGGQIPRRVPGDEMNGSLITPHVDGFYDSALSDPQDQDQNQSSMFNELTPQQLQLFEQENSSLLRHYNDTLSKVTAAEKSLLEISSLQQSLVGHLSTQGEMIEQLVQDAQGTDENVRRGNKELKKASERSSTAKGVFWITVGICTFLVGWDLVF